MMMNPFAFGFPPIRRPYPSYHPPTSNFPEHGAPMEHKVHSNNSNFSGGRHGNIVSAEEHNFDNKIDYSKNDVDNFLNDDNKKDYEDYFEIFGLKLHFDDLLIIALLFFLYQEEVKDTYLYIALILLLLS